jgi:RNase P protein component
MGLLQCQTVSLKKNATKFDFAHAYCIHTQHHLSDTRWKRGASGKKNSGKVARWRFKRFTRTLFTDTQAQKTVLKLSAGLRRSWKFATSTTLFATGS